MQRKFSSEKGLRKTPTMMSGIARIVSPILHPRRPAHDGRDAGARDLNETERQHQADELLDLVAGTGDFEYKAFGRGVDHPRPEGIREPQGLDPVLAFALDLDHGELPLDGIASKRHVDDVMDRNKPVELVF